LSHRDGVLSPKGRYQDHPTCQPKSNQPAHFFTSLARLHAKYCSDLPNGAILGYCCKPFRFRYFERHNLTGER
jgi:hypothetical protein